MTMNRTEANAFARKLADLNDLEALGTLLSGATGIEIVNPDAGRSCFIAKANEAFRPQFDDAIAGIAAAAAARAAEIKASLGIVDDPVPAADDAPAAQESAGTGEASEKAGDLAAEPQVTALGEATDPPAAPAMGEPASDDAEAVAA